jgi:hypothetical protein
MAAPDLPIHSNQNACITNVDGISVRDDVLFTNENGEKKQAIEKRTTKILHSLAPAMQHLLQPAETVLYALKARSPLSLFEQLTATWWTAALAACAIVVTNKRLLFFPINSDGSWRQSVRSLQWGDLNEIKLNGMLVRNARFTFKNGTRATYTNLIRADAKKLSAISSVFIPAASGEQTSTHGPIPLCPDCREKLTAGQYSCLNCGLTFKDEKTMVLRSILLPGGGYFYTGHPLIAIVPAIVEVFLVLKILRVLLAGFASPQAGAALFRSALLLCIFWAIETAITVVHCRRYIRDFIPDRRNPGGVSGGAVP